MWLLQWGDGTEIKTVAIAFLRPLSRSEMTTLIFLHQVLHVAAATNPPLASVDEARNVASQFVSHS